MNWIAIAAYWILYEYWMRCQYISCTYRKTQKNTDDLSIFKKQNTRVVWNWRLSAPPVNQCEICPLWIAVKIRWSQYNASLPPRTNNVMIALQRWKDWFGRRGEPYLSQYSFCFQPIICWDIFIQAIFMISYVEIFIFRQYSWYHMLGYFYSGNICNIIFWDIYIQAIFIISYVGIFIFGRGVHILMGM